MSRMRTFKKWVWLVVITAILSRVGVLQSGKFLPQYLCNLASSHRTNIVISFFLDKNVSYKKRTDVDARTMMVAQNGGWVISLHMLYLHRYFVIECC